MLALHHSPRAGTGGVRLCDGLTRRQWLSVGSLATLGLSLPQWFARGATSASRRPVDAKLATTFGKARACIQIFLWGGPGAQETWDPKPHAPDGTRGDFKPIATSVPGFQICEHMPRLAQRAHQYAIIRSLAHTGVNHGTSAYHMLTGHIHWSPGTLRHPTRQDVPNLGANAARFLKRPPHLPPHVHLPSIVNDGDGLPVPGQGAGFLGSAHEPFQVLGDLTDKAFRVDGLNLAAGVPRARLRQRVGLREAIDAQSRHLLDAGPGPAVESAFRRAVELLQSPQTEAAFDLAREPERVREAYGWHHFAQALLLSRRLVEAGVPFVTVYWNAPRNTDSQSWDTHTNQHARLKDHLLPPFDQALAAFLDDLQSRGLLDETLVTWYGEFGRTPVINRGGGRDHWGFCQSIGLTGAGIVRGAVHGASTRDGGYAERDAVSPDDLAATIFHCLGIDHTQHMFDLQNRPVPLSYGNVVRAVLQ